MRMWYWINSLLTRLIYFVVLCGFIFMHDMSKEQIFSDFYVYFWFQYIFRHLMNIGMFLMYEVTSTMWMMIEFYHTNLKVSQYWLRYRFDATRHQATIWTIIYQHLWCHMAILGFNELTTGGILRSGARPTNGISIEFEIRSKFGVM